MRSRLLIAIACLPLAARMEAQPHVAGCTVFPANNVWNAPVDTLPVDPNSNTFVTTIGAGQSAHADFGSGLWDGGPIGIPFVDVPGTQAKVSVTFEYDDESDHAVAYFAEPIHSAYVLIQRDHPVNVTSLEHERWKRAHPEVCRKMGIR